MSWITNINFLNWVVNPSVNQTVNISYREGGTVGAFTSSGTVTFAPDGTIVDTSPYQITGINDAWATIEVNFINQCSMADYLQTFTKPV